MLNGGRPRRDGQGNYPGAAEAEDPRFGALGWSTVDLNQSQWIVANDQGVPVDRVLFGAPGGIAVVGDFNGDGVDDIGLFVDGYWMLDLNGNRVWDDGDLMARLGSEGDLPVVGDWDGDGKDDIGIFGASWGPATSMPRSTTRGYPMRRTKRPGGRRMFRRSPSSPPFCHGRCGERSRARLAAMWSIMCSSTEEAVTDRWSAISTATALPRSASFARGSGSWTPTATANLRAKTNGSSWARQAICPSVARFQRRRASTTWASIGPACGISTPTETIVSTPTTKCSKWGGPHDQPTVGDFNGDGTDEIAVYQEDITAPPM